MAEFYDDIVLKMKGYMLVLLNLLAPYWIRKIRHRVTNFMKF